jgi:hypothetical protein
MNGSDIDTLQIDLDRLGDWAVESAMEIHPGRSKDVMFTRARVKDPLNYFLWDQIIPGASSCRYLGIILGSDFSWAYHVKYIVKRILECNSFHNVCS